MLDYISSLAITLVLRLVWQCEGLQHAIMLRYVSGVSQALLTFSSESADFEIMSRVSLVDAGGSFMTK